MLGHLPLIVHITAGSLQLPSAVQVIFETPVRSYPISHRWVAKAPYVVIPGAANKTLPLLGLVGDPQSVN